MHVAVIGGGPSGLNTLKHLLQAHKFQDVEPIQVKLFEAKDQIGGTLRYRVWEDAEVGPIPQSPFISSPPPLQFPWP
jgi:dimethylaniline monooxygenase (N-oxide forming)